MISTRLRCVGFSIALLSAWACQPDLDALVVDYAGGSAGSGTSGSGGRGGSSNAGNGGTSGDQSLGGEGGDAGTAGKGQAGSTSGSSGDSGAPPIGNGSCENSDKDSNESDVDCGGSSDCERCDNNLRCSKNDDCSSGFCKGTRCAEPTCADGYKNQDETGRDCGGSCAPELACDVGVSCEVHEDCTSEYCQDEVCTDHCISERRDADETDKDCGGSECEPCGDGDSCNVAGDCVSKVCFNNECQPATCDDNVKNQDESDRDCGGVCAVEKPCQIDDACNGGADCESYVCTQNRCAPDVVIPAEDVIDYMEDGNFVVDPAGARVGNWYPYGDGTGTNTAEVTSIPGTRGPTSSLGFHVYGTGHTVWGSGLGADLNNSGGGQLDKLPYDASAYTGVTFWARAEADISVTVVLPDKDTDAAGGTCVTCDHHYLKAVQIGTAWKRYTVLFSEVTLEPGGDPVPTAFAPDGVVSVQFRFNPGITYDLWIDDVAFVK